MNSARKGLFVGLAVLALFACAGCSVFSRGGKAADEAMEVPKDAPVRIVDVIARKYSFEPSSIRVKQGEMVVLQLTSRDVVHGIGIPSARIKADISPGQITEVHFYARKKGIISFQCSNYCGIGHFNMRGKIIVE
jgi:cytochrome c oxidase subunit 2